MTPVTWLAASAPEQLTPEPLWREAVTKGWIPTQLGRVVVHVQGPVDDALVRDTALSLIAYLQRLPTPPRIEIVDAERTRNWPGVERLDLRAHPRYLVDVACLRDGALIPEAWFDDVFVVTIVGLAPDRRLGMRGVLAAQSALLEAPRALDLDVAFAAHRLLRSSLCIACGATTYGDRSSGSWWAISPDDIALERALASHAGARPDDLPVMRHFARHELLATGAEVAGAPRLQGYMSPSWRVALVRLGAMTVMRGRRAIQDLELSVQNVGRLPQFLQRRMPRLARFGRAA